MLLYHLYLLALSTLAVSRSVPTTNLIAFPIDSISKFLSHHPPGIALPLLKREWKECEYLTTNQDFPCEWSPTPDTSPTTYYTLTTLTQAQLGSIKDFKSTPSRSRKRRDMVKKRQATTFTSPDTRVASYLAQIIDDDALSTTTVLLAKENPTTLREMSPTSISLLGTTTSLSPTITLSTTSHYNSTSNSSFTTNSTTIAPNPVILKRDTQAILNGKGQEDKWCGLPGLYTYPCTWNSEDPHLRQIFAPYIFCKWIVLTPSSIFSTLSSPLESISGVARRGKRGVVEISKNEKVEIVKSKSINSREIICTNDPLTGARICHTSNAGHSLSPPRIFILPTLAFQLLGRIPGVLTTTILNLNFPESESTTTKKTLQARTPTQKCSYDGYTGQQICQDSAGYSLSPPRIFTLPTLAFQLLGGLPGVLTAAIPNFNFPESTTTKTILTPGQMKIDRTEKSQFSNAGVEKRSSKSHNAGSSLSPPRIFSFVSLLFNLPRSLAATIPFPAKRVPDLIDCHASGDDEECRYTDGNLAIMKGGKVIAICDGDTTDHCWVPSASSSLRPLRIFSVPGLVVAALVQAGEAVAGVIKMKMDGPRGFTESLAAPSFELVDKAVGSLVGWFTGCGCGQGKGVVHELRKRDRCQDDGLDGYCKRADAGQLGIKWAVMGVVGLAGIFAVFM